MTTFVVLSALCVFVVCVFYACNVWFDSRASATRTCILRAVAQHNSYGATKKEIVQACTHLPRAAVVLCLRQMHRQTSRGVYIFSARYPTYYGRLTVYHLGDRGKRWHATMQRFAAVDEELPRTSTSAPVPS